MRKHFPHIIILTIICSISHALFGQTDTPKIPKPVIKGDSLLCPNSTGTLRTQKGYDTYQWYMRYFGSDKRKPIEGANSNELTVSSNDAPSYFSVVVTAANIKRKSDEKLVDGLVFLLPSVISSGDFKNGPGYFILKEGDTGIFTLTKPYRTSITWYKNNEPIRGETSYRLRVTKQGAYTVQGAPRACPNYIVPLGVDLYVKVKKDYKIPMITGDDLLCPDRKGTLTTDKGYDSYQWFKRPFGQNKKIPIRGANSNTLSVDPIYDAPAYFSVGVIIDNDTLFSKEKLVDTWAFLPPAVMSDGDFIAGPDYFLLNKGDTGIFTLMQPYTTSITWYRNGEPIPGAISPTLYVTNRGYYSVEGAPDVCPGYIQTLGVTLRVKLNTDSTRFNANSTESANAVGSSMQTAHIKLYPNPAKDHVIVDASAFAGRNISLRLFSADGRNVLTKKYNSIAAAITVDLANIKPGIYYVEVINNSKRDISKLVITK